MRDTPYLGVSTDSGRFLVATSDGGVGRSLFVKSGRPEFRVLSRAVRVIEEVMGREAVAGKLFIDIGANIGTTTVCALSAHGFGSAVCCEPERENNQLLRANLALNDLDDRARTLQVAVSSRIGHSSFVVMEERRGASWVAVDRGTVREAEADHAGLVAEWIAAHPGEVPEAVAAEFERLAQGEAGSDELDPARRVQLTGMRVVDVELVTLDQLVEQGIIDAEHAGLLWIDAEGHEAHILQGARRLAARGVPIVSEIQPAGLATGDRETIHATAEEFYTHFVDVRRHRDRTHERLDLRPVTELREHTQLYLEAPSDLASFTDLLLLRLDAEQAAGLGE